MRIPVHLALASTLLLGTYTITYGVPFLEPSGSETTATAKSGGARNRSGATVVTTEQISFEPYVDQFKAIGTTVASKSVELKSEVAGHIVEEFMSSSRTVTKGDVLVRLDSAEEAIAVQKAAAQMRQAEEILKRNRNMGDAISAAVIDELVASYALAKAEYEMAEVTLAQRTIRAPISGVLGLTHIEEGDYLSVGSEIVTIDDSSSMLVDFSLPEKSISILSKNPTLELHSPAYPGLALDGEIIDYDSRVDTSTRSVSVRAVIDNSANLLLSGMTIEVEVMQESDPGAAVPAMAVTWSETGPNIWVLDDSIAKRVPVNVLHRDGNTTWIAGDLDPSTEVIVEGTHKVRNGAAVVSEAQISGNAERLAEKSESSMGEIDETS